jgi:hypothetical protein
LEGDPRGEPYALVTSCSDVVAFLKSSEIDPAIGLILIAIGVEPEYRSVPRSLSGWGTKGEPNALITAESEVTNFFRSFEADPAIGLIYNSYQGRARV